MSDLLTKVEKENVHVALRYLRTKAGGIAPLAAALKVCKRTLMSDGEIGPTLVFKVARFADVPVGDVLTGRFPGSGVCPHCGHDLPQPMTPA